MKKEITFKEAKKTIELYPDEDDYILKHLKYFMTDGEADDNSIELWEYHKQCCEILNKDAVLDD